MESRYANIAFDDFQTDVSPLDNAGLAQGYPLSRYSQSYLYSSTLTSWTSQWSITVEHVPSSIVIFDSEQAPQQKKPLRAYKKKISIKVRPGLDKLGSHLLQKKQKYYI
jgi:hypothetical protein